MKDFDNFLSWSKIEANYFSKFRKYPHFDNEYSWAMNNELLSCGIFFYYSYYHLGTSFLSQQLEILNLPRKETVNKLINLCDDFIHESVIDFYNERYFTFIKDSLVQNIIKDFTPITEDSIKDYIVSKNTDLHIKSKAVGYMIAICFDLSEKAAFSKYFGLESISFMLGTKFEDIFNFIFLHNKPLYEYISHIRKFISKGLHSIGFFDDYDPAEELSGPLSYIPHNFYSIKYQKRSLSYNEIPWKYVTFLNGELQIYNPRHPDGQGKYKPFYYRTEKSIKAFNQVKEYIINKFPPIKAIFNDDDIIVSIDTSCVESIDDALDILNRHIGNPVYSLDDNFRFKTHFFSSHRDYTNTDVLKYIEKKKSFFLNTLCELHLNGYKIYYCTENRINSGMIKNEEDAFIFTLASNDDETMFAYENTEDNRATYLFICEKDKIENTIKLISDYFSSGLINKRETISNNLNPSDFNINSMFKVSHSDSNWKNRILAIRNEILKKVKL